MTIKQHGGIFGRNPSFNDAEINGDFVSNGSANLNGTNTLNGATVTGNIWLQDAGLLQGGYSALRWSIGGTDALVITPRTGNSIEFNGVSTAKNDLTADTKVWLRDAATLEGGYNTLRWSIGGTDDLLITPRSGYNTKIVSGNVVIGTSGNGIDFSATSGTGTSELFDDYEEGTWTPSLAFGTSVVLNSAAGTYTKMGRLVYVTFNIDVTSHTQPDSSPISINGLPYNIASDIGTLFSIDPVASTFIDLTTTPLGGIKTSANTYLQLHQTDRSSITYTEAAASGKLVGAAMYEAS